MAAAAMNAWMRDCCCMAAAAMNAWICGYVSYRCVSYGYVRVDVVAMDAWKHESMNAWMRELWMRGCCCYECMKA